jgi:DNA polymerase III delta prime subunit
MNESFLKKYRPRKYKDFIINPMFITLLNTLIDMNNLNVLLVGGPSCGKSSLLDATIREYYKLDEIPIDNILYINNLYEQGISYYRSEVKTFCQTISSIPGKKKFIVLDDIDILNEQSQQVFRNCIDKYSHNVNFIASCTNTHKVVESLQSRSTIIKIKSVSMSLLQEILDNIKDREDIIITPEAQEFILSVCNGSIRMLINYMEKFNLLDENITLERAKQICTNISFCEFERYTDAWNIDKDITKAVNIIKYIFEKGYSVMDILDSYFKFVKITPLLTENKKYICIKIICAYISRFHTQHEDEIELIFLTHDLLKI